MISVMRALHNPNSSAYTSKEIEHISLFNNNQARVHNYMTGMSEHVQNGPQELHATEPSERESTAANLCHEKLHSHSAHHAD